MPDLGGRYNDLEDDSPRALHGQSENQRKSGRKDSHVRSNKYGAKRGKRYLDVIVDEDEECQEIEPEIEIS